MAETKHTAGPWKRAGRVGYAEWIVVSPPGTDGFAQIATVYGPGVTPESEHNALLIAAAPDLLAALILADEAMNHMGDVLNDMDACEPEDEEKCGPAFEAVRAAIAKATGAPYSPPPGAATTSNEEG